MVENGTVTIAAGSDASRNSGLLIARTPDGWRPPPEPTALGVARLTAADYLALNARARRAQRIGQLILLGAVVVGYLLGRWR